MILMLKYYFQLGVIMATMMLTLAIVKLKVLTLITGMRLD